MPKQVFSVSWIIYLNSPGFLEKLLHCDRIKMLNKTYHSKILIINIHEKVGMKFGPIGSGVRSHKSELLKSPPNGVWKFIWTLSSLWQPKSLRYVRTKFQKFLLIFGLQQACTEKFKIFSDSPSGHQKSKFVWTSQSGLQKWQFCSDQPQKIAILLPDSVSAALNHSASISTSPALL